MLIEFFVLLTSTCFSPSLLATASNRPLSKYPAAEVLSGPWLYCDFDVALTRQFLACLRADACRMSLVAKAVAPQCSKTEKWYDFGWHVFHFFKR